MQTVAEFIWAVKPDSPIKTAADLKGKKIGYTNPRSTSQALAILVLEKAGLKPSDAELVKTGGFGEGIVALDLGAVDITPIPEPLWSKNKDKYRAVVRASDVLPPLDNVVGVTTGKAAATRGDFIRAVIRARRQAVDFMYANPDEFGRHHRQGLQSLARGRAQRGEAICSAATTSPACATGAAARSISRP